MIFLVRLITSFCYAALLLGSLYLNTLFFLLVVLVMTMVSLFEIQRITKQKSFILYLFFPVALILSFIFKQANMALLILGIIGAFFMMYFFWSKQKIIFTKTYVTSLSFFNVSVPLVLLVLLSNQSPDYVAFFFGSIWLNDTGAYLVGSSVGKRPLAPNISPNKTIEGSIGGIAIATIIMFFVGGYFEIFDAKVTITATVITAIFGGLGDLVQSKIKRKCNVKDSGKVLPGHGGMYDRLDSSLLAISFYILILVLFGYVS